MFVVVTTWNHNKISVLVVGLIYNRVFVVVTTWSYNSNL